MRWAGKRFHSTEDVDPVIVYDAEHKRTWNADWGHARVCGTMSLFSSSSFYLAKYMRANGIPSLTKDELTNARKATRDEVWQPYHDRYDLR